MARPAVILLFWGLTIADQKLGVTGENMQIPFRSTGRQGGRQFKEGAVHLAGLHCHGDEFDVPENQVTLAVRSGFPT